MNVCCFKNILADKNQRGGGGLAYARNLACSKYSITVLLEIPYSKKIGYHGYTWGKKAKKQKSRVL